MSDVFQGPGWWMASDGKWYAPDRHPDEGYRNQFVGLTLQASEEATFPSVELRAEAQTETTSTAAFSEMVVSRSAGLEETAEISGEDLAEHLEQVEQQRQEQIEQQRNQVEQQKVRAQQVDMANSQPVTQDTPATTDTQSAPTRVPADVPVRPEQTFSVAAPPTLASTERPIFDGAAPASVVDAPRRPASVVGRTELEVGASSTPASASSLSAAPVTAEPLRRPSTALVHLPAAPLAVASTRDRVLAVLIFLSGITMIVGTFLVWTTEPLLQSGWERGEGIATILGGVLGSAMAGPIFVGFRHVLPKATAIVAGFVGIMVVGLAAISDGAPGIGFYAVLTASIVMVAAAVADQGDSLT